FFNRIIQLFGKGYDFSSWMTFPWPPIVWIGVNGKFPSPLSIRQPETLLKETFLNNKPTFSQSSIVQFVMFILSEFSTSNPAAPVALIICRPVNVQFLQFFTTRLLSAFLPLS